jgi:formylglycine-generating enzyme required for sulfatase activity
MTRSLTALLMAAVVSSLIAIPTAAGNPKLQSVGQNDSAPIEKSIRKNSQDGLIYLWIPAGTFTMGCSNGDEQCFSEEKPAHQVTISKGFWIGQTEVTVEAYEKFAGITEDRPASDNDQHGHDTPVVNVTWDEATDFCKWAGGRLPTEAEWEYAARGGSSASRYGELDDIAWHEKNSGSTVHPAGQKRANKFGLFDMLGNAWEWINDWYDGKYYARSPEVDPAGPETGQVHGLRGGSWLNNSKLLRASDRGRSLPELRFNYFGLRCVLTADGR